MLHHVELYVSDLARSLRFWTPLFGLLDYREFQRWPEGVSYMHGDTYLCLVQAPQQHLDAGYHRQRVGLNHLAFHGRSRAHVDEIAAWGSHGGLHQPVRRQVPLCQWAELLRDVLRRSGSHQGRGGCADLIGQTARKEHLCP